MKNKEKEIEEMAWELCDIPKHPSIKSCEQCGNKHCHAMYYAERAYNAGYRKAPDVAREIFEEIDSLFDKHWFHHIKRLYDEIAKLKKKYESEGER